MTSSLRWTALLVLLAGCDPARVQFFPDLWAEWNDTGLPVPIGQMGIDQDHVDWGCNSTSEAYWLEVYTVGPAGGGRLTLLGPDGVSENHPLVFRDGSPDGSWDLWTAGPLADGEPAAVPGSATRFDCAAIEQPLAVVQIADRFGSIADCVAIGSTEYGLVEAVAELGGSSGCSWIQQ